MSKTPDTRAVDVDQLEKQSAPGVDLEFRVFFAEHAFDRAIEHGGQDLTREVGGVLVGQVCRDDAGAYVRVDTTIDALHADEQGTEVTFTHETWDHVHKEMDADHEGKAIVGWYHTHPGFGIFLSDRDQFIHRSFFNLPHQVALVYDPKSREHGVFAWRDGEPVRWPRYWVGRRLYATETAVDADRASGPDKIVRRTPEDSPAGSVFEQRPGSEDHSAPPERLQPSDLALGAAVLLLIGGFVGWWIGGSRAAGSADVDLARLRLDTATQTVQNLNSEVVTALRLALGGRERVRPLDQAYAALAQALEALASDPPDAARARAAVARASEDVGTFTDTHVRLESLLLSMESVQRRDRLDPRDVQRLASTHAAALGQLCAELADLIAKDGDRARSERLLKLAQKVDPTGQHGRAAPPTGQETPR